MISTSRPGRGIVAPLFTQARIKAENLIKTYRKQGKVITLGEALAIINPPKPAPQKPQTDQSLRLHLINKGLIVATAAPVKAAALTTK